MERTMENGGALLGSGQALARIHCIHCLRADAAQPTVAAPMPIVPLLLPNPAAMHRSHQETEEPLRVEEPTLSLDSGQVQGRYRSVHRLGRQGGMRGALDS